MGGVHGWRPITRTGRAPRWGFRRPRVWVRPADGPNPQAWHNGRAVWSGRPCPLRHLHPKILPTNASMPNTARSTISGPIARPTSPVRAARGGRSCPTSMMTAGSVAALSNDPALARLRNHIGAGRIDMVVVYKIDRLSRSLRDFVNLVSEFEAAGTAFVSVTQSFDTSTSMGRLMLNVLLSFAQFERELTGERLRDWFAGARSRGLWHAAAPLGYVRGEDGLLHIDEEAPLVRHIFRRYPQGRLSPLSSPANSTRRATSTTGGDHLATRSSSASCAIASISARYRTWTTKACPAGMSRSSIAPLGGGYRSLWTRGAGATSRKSVNRSGPCCRGCFSVLEAMQWCIILGMAGTVKSIAITSRDHQRKTRLSCPVGRLRRVKLRRPSRRSSPA